MTAGERPWHEITARLVDHPSPGRAQLIDYLNRIVTTLELEAAGLKLFDFAGHRRLSLSWPVPEHSSQIRLAAAGGRRKNGASPRVKAPILLPLELHGRKLGLLRLELREPPARRLSAEERQDLSERTLALLGRVERQIALQAMLFAELCRRMHLAASLPELARVLCRGLYRFPRAAGVVLRPLHGRTVLGSSIVAAIPGCRRWGELFQALDEKYAPELLFGGPHPAFRQLEPEVALPEGIAPTICLVPAMHGRQMVGTLTLFGGWPETAEDFDPLRDTFLHELSEQIGQALEQISCQERYAGLARESELKVRETMALLRMSRAMHGSLRLNALTHLLLSTLVVPEGGDFGRAQLFMLNERSGVLQGMLAVTGREGALIFPAHRGGQAWERPELSDAVIEAQRASAATRKVLQQRLAVDDEHPLSRCVRLDRVIIVNHPDDTTPAATRLAAELNLTSYACVPLRGKKLPLGVLVIDNPATGREISPAQLRFLELFASQAGAALENAILHNRLENAHRDLVETQERLIQGERLTVLGEMSASVAHELRNPLVAIGGFAQRLGRIAGEGKQKEYAEIIDREARRMELMLDQILAFSKKQILCFAECDLNQVLDEAVEMAEDLIGRAQVTLVLDKAPRLARIMGDHQKLRQVLINLVTNACHAMPEGGTLWVRSRQARLRGDEAVEIDVEDTGGGIAADVMRNIFNPFFTTKEQGTGLGLSISHRIIEHHRGEIEVFNTSRGARFTVRVPISANPQLEIDKPDPFG